MILIRADANERIGTGHIMRCLSIARAFVGCGLDVLFVTADKRGEALIRQKGFSTVCLDSVWTDMESDLSALKAVIKGYRPVLLLIDSYFVTSRYFRVLSGMARTVYIDDMNKECWNVDAIINYNIFACVYDYSWYRKTGTKLILYPQFAPLRTEFRNCPKHTIQDEITDILVSAGGADPECIMERIMGEICPGWQNVRFHFAVGALNPRLEGIKVLAEAGENIILHINEQHMSQLMIECDIAISAAGTTLYELCATGIPAITYTLADNQIVAAGQFEAQGIMLNAGDCRKDDNFLKRLDLLLKELVNDKKQREELSRRMQALVDGNGARRIVEELISWNWLTGNSIRI